MKTSEMTSAALDWAVAKCEELEVYFENGLVCLVGQPFDTYWRYWNPSADWAQGGPIIEREGISIESTTMRGEGGNFAWRATRIEGPAVFEEYGLTPLIAAMRCYVASKLGDEVEIPEELK